MSSITFPEYALPPSKHGGYVSKRPSNETVAKWSQEKRDEYNKYPLFNYITEIGTDTPNFANIAPKYVSKEKYIQHDPTIPDGLEGVINHFAKDPEATVVFRIANMSSENDHVWIHMKISVYGIEIASMEIFRFENGWIVEHWITSTQMTSGPFANDHPYF